MNLLNGWRAQVEKRTYSPWPGPRPMRAGRDDRSALVGRSGDSRDFTRLVYDTDVVIFTGASGVGKTSMLQLGLVPTLRKSDYAVLVCDDWNRSSDANSVDELIYRQAKDQLPARAQLSMEDGNSVLDTLDSLYPDRSVIVLDQFEELIRYQRREYQKVLRWVESAATDTRVRIVISLRVEYEHELRGHHGLRLGPFQQDRYELRPITDRNLVEQVIEGANVGRDVPAIDAGARDRLVDAWDVAGKADGSNDRGLLHLQALLFVLWMTRNGETIAASDLDGLERRLDGRLNSSETLWETAGQPTLFAASLAEAVQVALAECRAACDPSADGNWPGIDPVLARRSLDHVHAMSGHLSSGGYKVSQAREDLARLVIFRDGTTSLARFFDKVEPARRRLAELVDSSIPLPEHGDANRERLPDWLSVLRSDLFGEKPRTGFPWQLDRLDLTGGVLLGLTPEDSLLEELRSFYFALEWLRICELIRVTTPGRGQTMVTLIHDLFGEGLFGWTGSEFRSADAEVHQFAAVRGVEMYWPSDATESAILDPVLANLRWTACDVTADFKGVTFVNCDFRGTRFVGCTFASVAFVNCMLDDVEFLQCEIVGVPAPAHPGDGDGNGNKSAPKPGKPPAFFIADVPKSILTSLNWYREPRRPAVTRETGLYSQTAGVAAIPADPQLDPYAVRLGRQLGGLSLFGGRISSLKVRACEFGRDGRLALRQVAGTSVEFADQTHVRLDLVDAALRGFTITRPIIEPDDPNGALPDPVRPDPLFDITFSYSRIVNVWFGIGLSGFAIFDDCMVWQVFNAADRSDFDVTMTPSSGGYGLVNVGPLEPGQIRDFTPDSLGTQRDVVWETSRLIDYRERPIPTEIENQLRAAPTEDRAVVERRPDVVG